jgi:single-strand DNA-binding protein
MSTKTLTIEGNLGADPVIKTIPAGKKVCNFSIAVNEEILDEKNAKQKKVEWHNIECWDKHAEVCSERLTKGSKVTITGTLKINNWKDKEGKEKFSKVIVAREINIPQEKSPSQQKNSVQ